MGSYNFSIQPDIAVGLVFPDIENKDVEEFRDDYSEINAVELRFEEAKKLLEEQEHEHIGEEMDNARVFVDRLNWYLSSQVEGLENYFNNEIRVELEVGYYEGWQIYLVADDTDTITDAILSDVESHKFMGVFYEHSYFRELTGFDNTKEVKSQLESTVKVLRRAIIEYAYDNGLGLTSGGWCGGLDKTGVTLQRDACRADCDEKDWDRFLSLMNLSKKHNVFRKG